MICLCNCKKIRLYWNISDCLSIFPCTFCRGCSADSCFTSWSWSMCWNNCHVCNLSDGYGPRQDNRSGPFFFLPNDCFCCCGYNGSCNINWRKYMFVVLKFDRKFFALYWQTEKSPYQYRGMFHALSTVLREEGPRALYKGWLPSVIGVVSNLSWISLLR